MCRLNTYNRLERFKAPEYFVPIPQRLHRSGALIRRVRNGRITKGHTRFLWRVGPLANMSYQSLGNRDFEEHGQRAVHHNARHDLQGGSTSQGKKSTGS